MKKFIQILYILTAGIMHSQDYPLKLGIKAGWNYSNVNAIDEFGEPSGYLSDIIDEAYVGFLIEKQISTQSYIQLTPTVSFTDAVTFIEIPIYYRYNFYTRFSVLVGPKLNYIPDKQYNNSFFFRKRLGISGDIGVDYKITNHFTVEGTFSKGFTKQFDDLILKYYEARRNVYRVGVSYYF